MSGTDKATLVAALLGLLGVAAGAFGAHGLADRLAAEQLGWWETAARYQQIHAVALLVVAVASGSASGSGPDRSWPSRWRAASAWCFGLGIVIFAGTLYTMALGGPRWLGAITPLGGLALILGWGALAAEVLARHRARSS
jgi:uncharacterized membrane protein YgdD (TMEM256/DUF423 family)